MITTQHGSNIHESCIVIRVSTDLAKEIKLLGQATGIMYAQVADFLLGGPTQLASMIILTPSLDALTLQLTQRTTWALQ